MSESRPRSLRFPLALLASVSVGCCPVPTTMAPAPTAFVAQVVPSGPTAWTARAADGSEYAVEGFPPGPPGSHVYLMGNFAPDGALEVHRVDPLGAP